MTTHNVANHFHTTSLLVRSFLQVLQQLPSKNDIIEKVDMTSEQQTLYDGLRNSFNMKLKALDGQVKTVIKPLPHCSHPLPPFISPPFLRFTSYYSFAFHPLQAGVSMLIDLRKAANHRLLIRKIYTDSKLREMSRLILKVSLSSFSSHPDLRCSIVSTSYL